MIKNLIPASILDALHFKRVNQQGIINSLNWRQKIYEQWKKENEPIPPYHAVKQYVIEKYRAKYKYNTLVETGTFLGDMIESQRLFFNNVYSIELDLQLYNFHNYKT